MKGIYPPITYLIGEGKDESGEKKVLSDDVVNKIVVDVVV